MSGKRRGSLARIKGVEVAGREADHVEGVDMDHVFHVRQESKWISSSCRRSSTRKL